MDFTYLQLFILLNVFFMGALATIAAKHAYAHYRPDHDEHGKPHEPAKGVRLPPEVKEQMLTQSQAKFQKVLDQATAELQNDLKDTSEQLNKEFEKLKSEITSSETERYKSMLEDLRKHAETAIGDSQTDMVNHQEDLKAKLAEEMAAEQQRLIAQIDTKLADAVVSFLVENLGRDVDLGAQSTYLTKILEEHKDDFKRRVVNEESSAPTAK
jgi:F0F1-type ATP synthase membrane subunit b/b'